MTDMPVAARTENGWRRFWNQGGIWRATLILVVYWLVFMGIGQVVGLVAGDVITPSDPFGDVPTIVLATMLPIILGGALLMIFAASVGWMGELFGRQPIRGSWWMWIAPVVVVAFNLVRFGAADYDAFDPEIILLILLIGPVVGFTEELLTRGIIVNLMRRRGYREWMVMFVSSLAFALLHIAYLWTAGLAIGAIQLVYTFFFGVLMYLTLRVTGHTIWPILVHASTDPSTFLITGAIGEVAQAGESGPLSAIAGLANPVVIVAGLVLMFFVRGRVGPRSPEGRSA